jgi:hypothetical protein
VICAATGLERATHLMAKPRSICLSAVLVLGTVACGLLIRFEPLGLPRLVAKYGGSILWALTIYWIVSALLARRRIVQVALCLGRIFSVWDILAYWLAVAVGYSLDRRIFRSVQAAP